MLHTYLGQRGLHVLEGVDDVAECERLHLLEDQQGLHSLKISEYSVR